MLWSRNQIHCTNAEWLPRSTAAMLFQFGQHHCHHTDKEVRNWSVITNVIHLQWYRQGTLSQASYQKIEIGSGVLMDHVRYPCQKSKCMKFLNHNVFGFYFVLVSVFRWLGKQQLYSFWDVLRCGSFVSSLASQRTYAIHQRLFKLYNQFSIQ